MQKTFLPALLFFLSINGWVWGAPPESYMPLTDGMSWEFQHKFFDLNTKNQIGAGKSIKRNLPAMELRGINMVPQVFSFYQPADVLKQETTSFIGKDAAGFFVSARQLSLDQEPKLFPEKYYILKFPLAKGTSWKQAAEGFILENTIEATDAAVQVPAGSFNHCLVVRKLYFNPKKPDTPIQEAVFWFAPEVGNVKVVIKHPQENREIVQELVSFKR